jgi:hypothetical protein
MSALFKKSSILDRKIKRIGKDLSLVESEIKTLSKFVEKPEKTAPPARLSKPLTPEKKPDTHVTHARPEITHEIPKYGTPGKKPETQAQSTQDTSKVYEERFKDYFASSFQTVQVLRREKSMQRNRAIFMVIIVALVLWLLIHLL